MIPVKTFASMKSPLLCLSILKYAVYSCWCIIVLNKGIIPVKTFVLMIFPLLCLSNFVKIIEL